MTKENAAQGLGINPKVKTLKDVLSHELKCKDIHVIVFEELLDNADSIAELTESIRNFREQSKPVVIQPSTSIQKKIDKGIKR